MLEMFNHGAWCLESRFFNRISPLIFRSLTHGNDLPKSLFETKVEDYPKGRHAYASGIDGEYLNGQYYYFLKDNSKVLSLPVKGTLTKNGDLCSYGSAQLIKEIDKANRDDDVDAILLDGEGPGGTVDGITAFSDSIYNSEKPIIGFGDRMLASAHYWAFSQTTELVLNDQEYSEVGSIGVLQMLISHTEMLKKEGIKVEIMRAEQSIDKALINSVEEWPEASIKQEQQLLNSIANDFSNAVRRGRGSKLQKSDENIFTGKMYQKDQALSLGMVDHLGSKAEAIILAADYAKYKKKKSIII